MLGEDPKIREALGGIWLIEIDLDGLVVDGKVLLHPGVRETVLVGLLDDDRIVQREEIQEAVVLVGRVEEVGDAGNDVGLHIAGLVATGETEAAINAPGGTPGIADPPEGRVLEDAPTHNLNRMSTV